MTVRLKWKHLFVALAVAAALVLTAYVAVEVGRSINEAQARAQAKAQAATQVAQAIQQERRQSILFSCREQNQRHTATVGQLTREEKSPTSHHLDRALYAFFVHHHARRLAAAFAGSEAASRRSTTGLIDALAPYQNCALVVRREAPTH